MNEVKDFLKKMSDRHKEKEDNERAVRKSAEKAYYEEKTKVEIEYAKEKARKEGQDKIEALKDKNHNFLFRT
jgi:hypothetical protein